METNTTPTTPTARNLKGLSLSQLRGLLNAKGVRADPRATRSTMTAQLEALEADTTPTTDLAAMKLPELRELATAAGIETKGLRKPELIAALEAQGAAQGDRSAKAAATRSAKASAALTAWGKGDDLAEARSQIENARELLAHWTGIRDELVFDGKANDVPFSTLADLLGMAEPGVRAITLRKR